jgi:hypothetical protein
MLAWYHDIEQLVQLPHMSLSQRQTFIASHAPEDVNERNRQSGSSSPGLDEDEADEVPYSHTQSIEELTPATPTRPVPGGSFPSETQLDAEEMYAGNSPTASDVTHDNPPARISTDEDVAEVFGERPMSATQKSYERLTRGGRTKSFESMGDDKAFTATAIGAGAGAAAATAYAEHERAGDMGQQTASKDLSPHEAAGYYAGNIPSSDVNRNATSTGRPQLSSISPSGSQSSTVVDPGHQSRNISKDVTSEAVAAGAILSTAPTLGSVQPAEDHTVPTLGSVQRVEDFYHEPQPRSEEVTGHGIETQPPKEYDTLPAEFQNPTTIASPYASLMQPPTTSVIKRSKSRKEIVEEKIADSMGNHPERGMLPGFYPATPAETSKDGYL